MGTANNALTTPDLYFTWCMAKGVRVHLGYWLAQACHQVTANPSRHLYTCHLLEAYLQRNVIMKIHKSCRVVKMCLPPETFNVDYFFNKGLLITRGRDVCFYEIGKLEAQMKQEPEMVETHDTADMDAGARLEVEEVRTEIGWMRSEMKMVREEIIALQDRGRDSVDVERVRKLVEEVKTEVDTVRNEVIGVRKEVTEIRNEVGKSRDEVVALKGRVADLVAASSWHSDKMAEGVSVMMAMTKWLRARFPETPKELPGSSAGSKPPGQGSPSIQKPPQAPRPQTTPSSSRPSILKKTVPLLTEEQRETPESPARKKAKVTPQTVPPRSGSRGGQTPN